MTILTLTDRGDIEIDHEGHPVTVSQEAFSAVLATSQADHRWAARLFDHYRHLCFVCGDLRCYDDRHVRTLRSVRGSELCDRVREVLKWQPEWSRAGHALHNGYTRRTDFERAMRTTNDGATLLEQCWKDTEARYVRPTGGAR